MLTRRHVSKDLEEVTKESKEISVGSTFKAEETADFKSTRLEHALYVNKCGEKVHVTEEEYMIGEAIK